MDLSSWRDIILIVWGLVTIIATISMSVIGFQCYRKLNSAIKSINLQVERLRIVADCAEDLIAAPGRWFSTLISGIIDGFNIFSNNKTNKE
ncbi:MAG: hypothetical protein A2Z02_06335 [Chloroflexi bacterium RBG_16_48_7]|nr:MAG: hypothetical protein A2Z02_06335 [Chloroflexi bacterium RBG_16_48_7]